MSCNRQNHSSSSRKTERFHSALQRNCCTPRRRLFPIGAPVDITNKKFGRWTAVRRIPNSKGRWLFKCDCGTEKAAFYNHVVVLGVSKSCGCLRRELLRLKFTTHGRSKIREYKNWASMTQRCKNPNNPDFKNYGGRGIKICKRWARFENFFKDMGHRPTAKHSIDRKDNDGNYCRSNCRWATVSQQRNNRRNNRLFRIGSERLTISQIAHRFKIPYQRLHSRLTNQRWTLQRAVLKNKFQNQYV